MKYKKVYKLHPNGKASDLRLEDINYTLKIDEMQITDMTQPVSVDTLHTQGWKDTKNANKVKIQQRSELSFLLFELIQNLISKGIITDNDLDQDIKDILIELRK